MRKILSLTLLILLPFWGNPLSATPLTNIVVFGDSLSDNGNLYEYTKQQLPLSPPYFQGRFSNGYVWVELLAQHIFSDNWAAHLLDYAFGGAGVLGPNGDFSDDSLLSLNCEIDSYLLAHQDKASPDALFVVWIGANNYLAMPDEKDEAIEDVNWGIKTSIQRLVEHGAKHVLILNLPDLGQTPLAREFETQEDLSYYSARHNTLLAQNVEYLKATYPDVQWVFFDINDLFQQAIQSPQQFGFTNMTDTCYESVLDRHASHNILSVVSHIKPALKHANACDGYFFFDLVHPTGSVHQIVADKVYALLNEVGAYTSSAKPTSLGLKDPKILLGDS